MKQLYKQQPVSISSCDHGKKLTVRFNKIKMVMGVCRFIHFRNYLEILEKKIDRKTEFVELRLVKDNLTVEMSLSNFLLLVHGVETVYLNKTSSGNYIRN